MTPYYVTDVAPAAARSVTLHGAWSHYPNGPLGKEWEHVLNAGFEVFERALSSMTFDAEDEAKFWLPWMLANPGVGVGAKHREEATRLLFDYQKGQ